MKSYLILLTLLFSTGVQALTLQSFKANDIINKKELSFAFPSQHKNTVVVFVSAKCPCSASHEEILKNLSKDYKEFNFVGVHSNSDETPDVTFKHFSESALPFSVIQDEKNTLANKLGALKTPHAFVLNQNGEVIYQGGVTDSHVGPNAKKQFLKEVLEDLRQGKEPRHKEGRALGCYIQREDET